MTISLHLHDVKVNDRIRARLAAEVRRLRSEIDSARDDLQSFVDARNEWKQRAEAAEKALKEAQEQEPVVFFPCDWKPTRGGGVIGSIHADAHFKIPLYARPVPAAPAVAAPAVPEDFQIAAQNLIDAAGTSTCSPTRCQYPMDCCKMELIGAMDAVSALLQSRAVKDSLTTQADCRACVNRGRVNGLSQESYCDSCVYEGRGWRQNHFVDARKMVDAVKRQCEACAILPCSCK